MPGLLSSPMGLLGPNVARGLISATLTPAERAVLAYHRQHLARGSFLTNPDGSLTTFRGAISGVPEGEMLYPTYWRGRVRNEREALAEALSSGIKWPIYKTPQEAIRREKLIHMLMESDVSDFQTRGER